MGQTDTTVIDPDTAYQLLADPYRRYLLDRLRPGEPVTRSELAAEIAARDDQFEAGDAASPRRIEIALAHDHLPRLADHGVIAYDPSTTRVVLTADRETRRLLEEYRPPR